MESFTKELVSNTSAQLFPDNTMRFFHKHFSRSTESGKSMRGCNFGKILPINVPKFQEKKFIFFEKKTLKVVKIPLSGTWSLPFH